jgi:hypothetical protein
VNENFPNLGKETNLQIQESEKTPNWTNPKKSMPRNHIIKLPQTKAREK